MQSKRQKSKVSREPGKKALPRADQRTGEAFPSSPTRTAATHPPPKPPKPSNPASRSREKAAGVPVRNEVFSIVGIGASAGGLDAFMDLLKHLPADSGLGFVLVQHLDPAHESALTQLLSRVTAMPVSEATEGQRVLPNQVYVIPSNAGLTLAQGRLRLHPRELAGGGQRSIDQFLQSLAESQHERAIGVVLSGTGTDGTLGLETIKSEGGISFAQDSQSARYDSMPQSAAAAGCVDFVLSPEGIARELVRLARHPYLSPAKTSSVDADPNAMMKILLLLRNRCGVDFSLYKPSTIQRRLARRVLLNKLNTLESYADCLRSHAGELTALYADMLISVTSFFRNPDAFIALKRLAFPKLTRPRREDPVRIWVLACSTGQEAYSLAMALVEHCEQVTSRPPKLQIFATDLNNELLDKARAGLYGKSVAQEVSPERLRRFFVEEDGGYRIAKRIREMCVFARQNVLSDPPFSRMDLISCRNLLIYLEPGAQKKILTTLHYALQPGGFLFLGASESVGLLTNLFECADKQQKIFFKRSGPTPAMRMPAADNHPAARPEAFARKAGVAPEPFRAEPSAQREADRVMIRQFAPPGVLVDAELQILEFRGLTGAYLEPPSGKASLNLLRMAREGLVGPLRAAIDRAKKENRTVFQENVPVRQPGDPRRVNLQVIPLKNLKEPCYLILFEEPERTPTPHPRAFEKGVLEFAVRGARRRGPLKARALRSPSSAPGGASQGEDAVERQATRQRIVELERELAEMRDHLRSIEEQHEAVDEEFQAANEELQSANEELHTINEELETSKEQIESTNEELITVNDEMVHRNLELNRLNSDLNNLQTSVHLAIVLLGRDLTVRRFSPLAEAAFNLRITDVGRPLTTIQHHLELPDLGRFVAQVIDTAQTEEREVCDHDGRWYLLRARPYLAPDNKIDGATLVLVDINALKLSERAAEAARRRLELLAEEKDELVGILTHDLKNLLSGTHMSAEMLRDSTGSLADPKLRLMVENISYSSGQMLAFVKQFLANASADHGLHLTLEPVSLSETAARTVRQYEDAAQRKQLVLHTVLPEINTFVQADAAALSQVLDNLLSNAVKFSPPEKQISIGVRSDIGWVECSIQDQGPGFTEEDKARMFRRYGKLSARPTGSEPSAGLGLSIVKKLVEAMGGDLTWESVVGSGTKFTVRLPRSAAQH